MLYIEKQMIWSFQHTKIYCNTTMIRSIETTDEFKEKLQDNKKIEVSIWEVSHLLQPQDFKKIEAIEKNTSLF